VKLIKNNNENRLLKDPLKQKQHQQQLTLPKQNIRGNLHNFQEINATEISKEISTNELALNNILNPRAYILFYNS
jgi:hypothetical protein